MVHSNEVWKRIWKLPLIWNEEKYQGNWVFKGGGFPFCRAYPKICEELHAKTEFHNNFAYLKQLTFETFMSDPVTVIQWKFPFFVTFWLDKHVVTNTIIILLFPIIFTLFFLRSNKSNAVIVIFSSGIFFFTFAMLFLAHIEVRYFYVLKFFLCFASLLSLYAFLENRKSSFPKIK